jgi:hypothetical protein
LVAISFISLVLTPVTVWAAGSSIIWGNNDSLGKTYQTKQAQQAAA